MATSKIDITRQAAFSGDTSVGFKLTNVTSPTSAQDAATKSYVDSVASGLDVKNSVRAATTTAGTLASSFANASSIDGVTLATGDRILIKNQAAGAENGIYTVNASGSPTRAGDFNSSSNVTSGAFTFVEEGTTNADNGFALTTDGAITVGTTALVFGQFSGAGQITAGAGLTKNGNTLDVVGTSNRITVNADSVDIAATYAGQTSITTLGTIATGTWTGTTIALANGGTGATTQAGAANAVLPSQTGNGGEYLTTDGTNVSWSPIVNATTFRRTTFTGTQDGSNKTFTLGNTPTAGSEQVVLNGQILNPGGTNDYTISGTTVTFTAGFTPPSASDALQFFASY